MKNFITSFSFKDLIYIILIIIVFMIMRKGCTNKEAITVPTLQPVINKVDKRGAVYTEITGQIYTKDQIKELLDSFAKVSGNKPLSGHAFIKEVVRVDTVFHTDIMYIDTFNHTVFDTFYNKDIQIGYRGNYLTRKGAFNLNLTPDTASYITYLNRHLFKATTMKVDVYHTNRLYKPVAGVSYTTSVPKVLFTVGPSLGILYDGNIRPYVGIGITYNLWSYKVR